MSLIRTALVLGAGYVLGTRAGRERYEQISSLASKLWESAPMKSGREKAKSAAAETFQQAKAAAAEKAKSAAETVKSKVASSEVPVDDDVIVVEPLEH